MSVTQPPSDTPFGLDQNVAAGLAYLFTLVGGIVMLVGGGTNKFVKWAAAQSIVIWAVYFLLMAVALPVLTIILGLVLHAFIGILWVILGLAGFGVWLWTTISAFQGKEVRVPVIADITQNLFKSVL